ncbi:MAG: PEGA domain-containing protein, partial [Myxococcota bacterium]|nr:PEGA domain-containing protein [Myxococcota bacterium]
MLRFVFTVFLVFLFCFPKNAMAEIRLAVLEFRGVGVQDSLLRVLSDKVRYGVLSVSDGQKIKGQELIIMTRENIQQVLKDQGKTGEDCRGECEVELARNIGADYVISGELLNIDELYVLSVKLHETERGNLLAGKDVETEKKRELLSGAQQAGAQVFQKGLKIKRNAAAKQDDGFQSGFAGEEEASWSMDEGSKNVVVSFSSNPKGAIVLRDGEVICSSTPCSKSILTGKHRFSIQKERYSSWSKTVSVSKKVSFNAELVPKFGYLDVTAKVEGVQVFLDGKKIGTTPIRKYETNPGKQRITIQDRCYTGQEYRFEARAGKTERVDYPLKPRPACIDVSVVDQDGNDLSAEIYIDGKYKAESPNRLQIPVCSKKLLVTYKGSEQSKSLSLVEKQVKDYKIVFKKDKPKKSDQASFSSRSTSSGGVGLNCKEILELKSYNTRNDIIIKMILQGSDRNNAAEVAACLQRNGAPADIIAAVKKRAEAGQGSSSSDRESSFSSDRENVFDGERPEKIEVARNNLKSNKPANASYLFYEMLKNNEYP